jgi:hypothetical protein
MLVELEAIDRVEVEAYLVRMVEEDGNGKALVIGEAKRISDGEFAFELQQSKGQASGTLAIVLPAKDKDELKQVISTRFGSFDIPSDRLRISTLENFADAQLTLLNALATNTGSMAGVAAALARSLARMIVEDIKPGTEDTFKTQFMANVEAHVDAMRRVGKLRQDVDKALGSLFRTLTQEDGNDSPTTTH